MPALWASIDSSSHEWSKSQFARHRGCMVMPKLTVEFDLVREDRRALG